MLSIKWRQYNLQYYYNYYKGAIDGIEGVLTKQAYKNFQKDHNLTVDGVYGTKTNSKLVSIVKDLQTRLNKIESYNLVIDGQIGTKTIAALKDFQKQNDLVIDGIAGKNTFAKLKELDSPTTSKYMTDEDWDNSKYFKKFEFTCAGERRNGESWCCGQSIGNGIYKTLVNDMNALREKLGEPIYISNAYRCKKFNNSLKGSSPTSTHMQGRACDWYSNTTKSQVDRLKIISDLKKNKNYNYAYCNVNGNYPNMGNSIHYDVKS